MTKRARKVKAWIWTGGSLAAVIIVVLVLWSVYFALANQPPDWRPTAVRLPVLNAYDDYVVAGQLLPPAADQFDSTKPHPDAELIAYLEECRPALARVREGFAHRCVVPPVASFRQASPELHTLRQMAHTLRAEADLAGRQGRWRDAARSYRDCLRLGAEVQHGGSILHGVMGVAIQSISLKGLSKDVDRMDPAAAKWLARELVRMDPERGTAAASLRAERETVSACLVDLFRRGAPVREVRGMSTKTSVTDEVTLQLAYVAHPKRVIFDNYRTYVDQAIRCWEQPYYRRSGLPPAPRDPFSAWFLPLWISANFQWDRRDAHWRIVEARLAARAFRAEHGKSPRSLVQLVPRYLPAVPQDPFRPRPLVYRLVAGSPLVYSVGPDDKDDSGQDLGSAVEAQSAGHIVTMDNRVQLAAKRSKQRPAVVPAGGARSR